MRTVIILLTFLIAPVFAWAQHKAPAKHKPVKKKTVAQPIAEENPLEILGMRPGITMDSVRKIMVESGALVREVREDTLTHSFGGQGVHIFVVDSIICRLTYMRMTFVADASLRLRRIAITPRESSIAVGATDDIENVLLLYFGQKWGKPELDLSPPLPLFRWKSGNIQMRGFIRRGYPMWVLEG